jgi:hypothetical protein
VSAKAGTIRALTALNALPFTARRAIASWIHVGDEGIIFLPGAGTCLLSRHAEDRFTIAAVDENEVAAYLMEWAREERGEAVQ